MSMGQVGVTVPVRLFRRLERQVLERYFPLNSCHFTGGKIKCRDALEFGGLPTALLEFQFESGFTLSLPLHLLLGTC